MGDLVLVEDAGAVRTLTLNRPEKLNAISSAMTSELSMALQDAAEDRSIRVVVLAGAGRSFCAGYDLGEDEDSGEGQLAALRDSLAHLLEVFDHPKPVIASVQGHCLAGGCDLMMMCDLAVASDDAVFGQPEIKFGSAIVAHVMPWLIGARRAKDLILTGMDDIGAEEAERIGLINRVVPRERLEDETQLLASRLALVDPNVMSLTKRAINQAWEASGFREALRSGVELGAIIESAAAPERAEFERIRREKGLREAVQWRDGRFQR